MPEIKKYSLVQELQEADKKFNKKTSVVGMSSMTFPGYINSTRTQMFTAHLKQFLNILEPQFPYVFTGAENVVGKHSTGYKKIKHDSYVYRKVTKFEDIVDEPTFYYLFIYDTKKKRYDVFERKEVEDLIEDFAFQYNNEKIDSLEEGDDIDGGEVLYKSRSYDPNMNYRYGRNATVAYTTDPWTSEDAAKISESFSKAMSTMKAKTHYIGCNLGEVMLNLYGTKEHVQVIPEIGQEAGGFLCGVRGMRKEQMYYDMSDDNMLTTQNGDRLYYGQGKGSIVTDITIYCNNPEIEENSFNAQILKYLRSQNMFYEELRDTCKEIMDSGEKYSNKINYLYKRAIEFLDTKKKWRNKSESCPANLEIAIQTRKIEPLGVGGKFTARMGNKSVVSKVVPDDEMPYTDTGKRVEVVLNLLAISNRTTGFVPHELFETFILDRTRERMSKMKTLEEKAALLFEIMRGLNSKEAENQEHIYQNMSQEEREEYIQDCIEEGIHIEEIPIWEERYIFFRLYDMWKKYDWLKPYKMYIKKWGQEFETLTPMYIGEMYMIRLKQTGERGFSARNAGAVNIKSLPERSYKNRNNTEFASDSAIRLGESEFLTLGIGTHPEEVMAMHALYRTSIKGRKDISRAAFSDNPIDEIDDNYTSVAAQLFSTIFRCLSMEIEFRDEEDCFDPMDDIMVREYHYRGKTYMMTAYEFYVMRTEDRIRETILDTYPGISEEKLNTMLKEEMKKVANILQEEMEE